MRTYALMSRSIKSSEKTGLPVSAVEARNNSAVYGRKWDNVTLTPYYNFVDHCKNCSVPVGVPFINTHSVCLATTQSNQLEGARIISYLLQSKLMILTNCTSLVVAGGQWGVGTYDDDQSLGLKYEFAKKNGVGIGIWAINYPFGDETEWLTLQKMQQP